MMMQNIVSVNEEAIDVRADIVANKIKLCVILSILSKEIPTMPKSCPRVIISLASSKRDKVKEITELTNLCETLMDRKSLTLQEKYKIEKLRLKRIKNGKRDYDFYFFDAIETALMMDNQYRMLNNLEN